MKQQGEEMISFDSLEIGYISGRRRKQLLPALTASAGRGELVSVIGRNGTGKSTLLRSVAGLQPCLGGTVMINGRNLSEITGIELARNVGYISTEVVRVSNMTVYDLVALGRFPHTNWIGTIDRESREAIGNAIISTGMENLAGRYLAELSDGERQRAMIARVLAQDTPIMIMDEPTAFLDIPGKFETMTLLRTLSHTGKTIIFSTHDLYIAMRLSDRVWLIHGEGLAAGTADELLKNGIIGSMFDSPGAGTSGRDYLKNFL